MAGNSVVQSLYCDVDEEAAATARHHLQVLRGASPRMLPDGELLDRQLPQDIARIEVHHLLRAGLHTCENLVVFAGWPCQPRSTAGAGRGIHDQRAAAVLHVHAILRKIENLRLAQIGVAPAVYWLENVPVGPGAAAPVLADQARVESLFGRPIGVDAARFDSLAHRERSIWTNCGRLSSLAAAVAHWTRDEHLLAQLALDPGRRAQVAEHDDSTGFGCRYQCNIAGEPLRAFPTLVSYPGSYAFRDGRSGVIEDTTVFGADGRTLLTEPNAAERERCHGMNAGATAASGVTEQTRCDLLGRAMDLHTLVALISLSAGLQCRRDKQEQHVHARMARMLEGLAPEADDAGFTAEEMATTTDRVKHLLRVVQLIAEYRPTPTDTTPAGAALPAGGGDGDGAIGVADPGGLCFQHRPGHARGCATAF